MVIKINNLQSRINRYRHEIEAATQRVLNSGWLVLGHEVNSLEKEFAEYIGVSEGVGVASGTDALELGLRGLGIEAGDRVATVANAGMYTSTALLAISAEPIYLDIVPSSSLVSMDEIAKAVAMDCKAIVLTHLYGKAIPETKNMVEYCHDHGVKVLEDCAQAHGAKIDGKCVGSFGDAAAFSFYPTKNLGAMGDGGMIVCDDQGLAQEIRELRQYGWTAKYQVGRMGGRNSRLDELQAAILRELLPDLDASNARRVQIAQRYSTELNNKAVWLPDAAALGVAHLYVIRCKARDELRSYLKSQEIMTDVHYPVPDHRQPLYEGAYDVLDLPVTEQLTEEILTLPCYPEMNDADIARVIKTINQWQA